MLTHGTQVKQAGRFITIPFVVLKSEDYRNLKPYAAKLLNLMLMQYNAKATVVDGIRFDSAKEARYDQQLKLRQAEDLYPFDIEVV